MIDVDETFADYGLDSITGVHLVQVINQATNIELETTRLCLITVQLINLRPISVSQYKDAIAGALGQEKTKRANAHDWAERTDALATADHDKEKAVRHFLIKTVCQKRGYRPDPT